MTCTDTLFLKCHYPECKFEIEQEVECGHRLTPSALIRWYTRMIAHVRKAHLGKRKAYRTDVSRLPER